MLALLAALATASAQDPAEVRIWHAYRGEERAALEAVLDEWDAAHPVATVTPLAVPDGSSQGPAVPRRPGPHVAAVWGSGHAGIVAPFPSPRRTTPQPWTRSVRRRSTAFPCYGLALSTTRTSFPPLPRPPRSWWRWRTSSRRRTASPLRGRRPNPSSTFPGCTVSAARCSMARPSHWTRKAMRPHSGGCTACSKTRSSRRSRPGHSSPSCSTKGWLQPWSTDPGSSGRST